MKLVTKLSYYNSELETIALTGTHQIFKTTQCLFNTFEKLSVVRYILLYPLRYYLYTNPY